jgi:hypothetical protein
LVFVFEEELAATRQLVRVTGCDQGPSRTLCAVIDGSCRPRNSSTDLPELFRAGECHVCCRIRWPPSHGSNDACIRPPTTPYERRKRPEKLALMWMQFKNVDMIIIEGDRCGRNWTVVGLARRRHRATESRSRQRSRITVTIKLNREKSFCRCLH